MVSRWFRTTRGTVQEALAALFAELAPSHRARARSRLRHIRGKLEEEGLDFSESKAQPAPSNVVRFEYPTMEKHLKPAPRPVVPPLPEGESVAVRTRVQLLEWTIDQAAAKAQAMPPDKSAAAYLKLITESHAELDQLRKTSVSDDVDLEQVLEFVSRIASDLPNAFVDAMVAEYLRRNPKHQVGLKARAV